MVSSFWFWSWEFAVIYIPGTWLQVCSGGIVAPEVQREERSLELRRDILGDLQLWRDSEAGRDRPAAEVAACWTEAAEASGLPRLHLQDNLLWLLAVWCRDEEDFCGDQRWIESRVWQAQCLILQSWQCSSFLLLLPNLLLPKTQIDSARKSGKTCLSSASTAYRGLNIVQPPTLHHPR